MFKDQFKAARGARTRNEAASILNAAGIKVSASTIQAWEDGRTVPPKKPKPTQREILAVMKKGGRKG